MRLFSILNGICQYIAARNKTLWSGSWSEGSITVPDTAKYRTFLIKFGTRYMFAINNGGNRIVGTYFFVSNNGQNIYQNQFEADISGNTWSIHSQTQVGHLGGTGHPQITQVIPGYVVEEIVGLEPILSAFVTIGGGYCLVPKGWWRHETIHHPIRPSQPHIHGRELDTDRTVFDSVRQRANSNYSCNGYNKWFWNHYVDVSKSLFDCPENMATRRHWWRLFRVMCAGKYYYSKCYNKGNTYKKTANQYKYCLGDYRTSLTPKGVAV